jgi:hypothetical protein
VPADPPRGDISLFEAFSIGMLFFVGWALTRGANMQKYYFKVRGR